MNKFWLSFFVIASFGLYAVYYGNNGSLNYVATPVAEVGKNNSTDVQNTTNGQVFQVPSSISGEDDDRNPFEDNGYIPPFLKSTPVVKPTTITITTPPVIKPNGIYKDGSYVGSNEYAYSGYVKVIAVILNGRLSDIKYSVFEAGPRTSQQIYNYSMPILKSEAISAQSAKINGVSGATYTSDAFVQSLAYALTQAKN